ncbi:uridine-cytidine kinase-like 1 [Sceloporus undulatus]|uniref:uridine-cytidine kinase-like 1 n=1 Tax=Sceloporus undulatus TaxID=8520 RepID=UPI001C4BC5E5|nr:uridine-cytidine kinase-like 1 [Sceloporus undulatus]
MLKTLSTSWFFFTDSSKLKPQAAAYPHNPWDSQCVHIQEAALASAHQCHPLPKTLSVLKNTPQVKGMHTIIRDKETSRDEFIFYSKRLMRLLIEHALSFLPFQVRDSKHHFKLGPYLSWMWWLSG